MLPGGARPSYPSQSGMEIQPSSRYVSFGLDGMLEGRWRDLLHASHSFLLFSLSFCTIVRAAAKGSMRLVPLFHPSCPAPSVPFPFASFTATRGIGSFWLEISGNR